MEKMSCGMRTLKYLLFAFNFVFWMAGVTVFGTGIWSRIKARDMETLLGDSQTMNSAPNLMIVAGIFVMFIGFVGCCGAHKEHKCLLMMYVVLLLLIFAMEIAAGIMAYRKKDDVQAELTKNIREVVDNDYNKNLNPAQMLLTQTIDWFQQNVKCCGALSANDWTTSSWFSMEMAVVSNRSADISLVPWSCCREVVDGCNYGNRTIPAVVALNETIYVEGCVPAGRRYIKDHLWAVMSISVGVAFIQIVGIVCAVQLLRKSGQYERF